MDNTTQQNAALVEQAAAQSLEDQANILTQVVSILRLHDAKPSEPNVRRVVDITPSLTPASILSPGMRKLG